MSCSSRGGTLKQTNQPHVEYYYKQQISLIFLEHVYEIHEQQFFLEHVYAIHEQHKTVE
jgi:hypothetical protein